MANKSFIVVRPICIDGERKEVGDTVQLGTLSAAEMLHAGKVQPLEAEAKAKAEAEAKPKARSQAK